MTAELILHNYDFSNFAEKVRLALGYKRLAWRSVIIPPVAPKPDLTPLTGGYRRTPVLQIGAEIFCDTSLILRELERRQPEPTLYPPRLAPFARSIAWWAERQLVHPVALYMSGSNVDVLPPNLQEDRAAMRGLPVPDEATVRRAALRNAPIVRTQIARVAAMLDDGRAWILGSAVSEADFAIYHALWLLTARTDRLAHELDPFPAIRAWMARMRGFGHGDATPMEAAEALRIAADASAAPLRPSQPFAEDPPIGSLVRIRADDYARDPVEGELVQIDREEVAIRREDPLLGVVVVHFPRLGYDLRPLHSR